METLLVLLLGSDPAGDASSTRLQALLAPHIDNGQVLSASAAHGALKQFGISVSDLESNPGLAVLLTKQHNGLVLVRVRPTGDVKNPDSALDAITTMRGQTTPFTAISASATEARIAAVRGVRDAIAVHLGGNDGRLAALASKADWAGLLIATPERGGEARERYYRVLALTRLGRDTEARQVLAEMSAAFPGHVLVAAAGNSLPSSASSAAQASDGSMRDGALPGDDGTNILR